MKGHGQPLFHGQGYNWTRQIFGRRRRHSGDRVGGVVIVCVKKTNTNRKRNLVHERRNNSFKARIEFGLIIIRILRTSIVSIYHDNKSKAPWSGNYQPKPTFTLPYMYHC